MDRLASLELAQILIVRRQQNAARGFVVRVRKSRIIALHGAVEIVEFRVLAKCVGIDFRGFGVGL